MPNSYRLNLPLACPCSWWLTLIPVSQACSLQVHTLQRSVLRFGTKRRALICKGMLNVIHGVAECAPPNNATQFVPLCFGKRLLMLTVDRCSVVWQNVCFAAIIGCVPCLWHESAVQQVSLVCCRSLFSDSSDIALLV